MIGVFLAEKPIAQDIVNFKKNYGKKPHLILYFIDWGHLPNRKVTQEVYKSGCDLFVTWEPWVSHEKKALDYEAVIRGDDDAYIRHFALQIKRIKGPVFIRFAHEANGNWYPWSGCVIGKDQYIALSRHMKDVFDQCSVKNVRWVFSVNWEDVPAEGNHFSTVYPGDAYVDYIGIDGYNWGVSKSWSKWRSFKEIFSKRIAEIKFKYSKPILISEFSSTAKGGDKGLWIREAMRQIQSEPRIHGFVLFNVDKESDWSFPLSDTSGQNLKRLLE